MRRDLHLCFGSPMTRVGLVYVWFVVSLAVGPGLILLGARAAGVGVLGSLGGAALGAQMAGYLDLLPGYMATGATAGLVACGLAGLFWTSPASRSTLIVLAVGVAAMGITSALVIHNLYLTTWTLGMQVLVALDAVFVAFLCLVQPIRSQRDDLRTTPSVGTADSPHT
jgi:hypothetical protein